MNPPKCSAEDYIQWLIASPKVISAVQAAQSMPHHRGLVAHDAYTRLLQRLKPETKVLWNEVEPLVCKTDGWLVVDDSTLDKPYGPHIELVTRHWSGKHRAVVNGINLITLLWTDGDIAIPIDWRVFNKDKDGLTKNDHLRRMLEKARRRGFAPTGVLWDSWYSSLDNLKMLRTWGWSFFVGLKSNRMVNPDGKGNRAISKWDWDDNNSSKVHLKGYGWVYAHRVTTNKSSGEDNVRYFVTDQSNLEECHIKERSELATQIEQYHRGLKQECNIERCQARKALKQRNHIALAIRAFVRLEIHRYRTGRSRFQIKADIIREAIRHYLANPIYTLPPSTA